MGDVQRWTVFLLTAFLLAAATILLSAGCGTGLPQVEGVVTLDERPLADARVVFQAPNRPMAVASTDAGGHYTVMTGGQAGMALGTYQVTISAYETRNSAGAGDAPVPKLRTPAIYNRASTSGLTAEIREGRNTIDFSLKSAPHQAR